MHRDMEDILITVQMCYHYSIVIHHCVSYVLELTNPYVLLSQSDFCFDIS